MVRVFLRHIQVVSNQGRPCSDSPVDEDLLINHSLTTVYFLLLRKLAIQLKFPAEHPYHSHISKCAVFPNFDSPDDVRKGKHAVMTSSTLPPTAAASAPDPIVVHKTKGNFAREEVVKVQRESGKDPLIWNEHNYYQVSTSTNINCEAILHNFKSALHFLILNLVKKSVINSF